jgi:hypothetical protein
MKGPTKKALGGFVIWKLLSDIILTIDAYYSGWINPYLFLVSEAGPIGYLLSDIIFQNRKEIKNRLTYFTDITKQFLYRKFLRKGPPDYTKEFGYKL